MASCSCTTPDFHLSSTTTQSNATLAWTVYFGNGFVANGNKKLFNYYVRAVRGGL